MRLVFPRPACITYARSIFSANRSCVAPTRIECPLTCAISSTAPEGGLGIGLALAKGLVELHGGQIKVNSAGRGEGSEFTVCLPRPLIVDASDRTPGLGSDVSANTASRRILIADDNRDGADSMKMLLESSRHEAYVANTGAEALELAKRVRPEIALLDIGMPDMSGYEVAEGIRREAWGKDLKLIAVTGWGQDSDKRRALAAGFDHHLTKPVDPAKLRPLLET